MIIAKITLFTNLRKLFDYKIPETMVNQAISGVRVKIPFGNKILIGLIVEITTNSKIAEEKIKSIIEIIDLEPILPKSLYQALLWAANYYQSSIGAILNCALP